MLKWTLSVSLVMILGLGIATVAYTTFTDENRIFEITYKVDGLEDDTHWKLLFSNFRSRAWDEDSSKAIDYYNANKHHLVEPNSSWMINVKKPVGNNSFPAMLRNGAFDPSDQYFLGVRGKWDKPGYNFLILKPSETWYKSLEKGSTPNWIYQIGLSDASGFKVRQAPDGSVELPGRIEYLSIWAWGMGYDYQIDAVFRDADDVEYFVPMGNLKHYGWKNLKANLPKHIPQLQNTIPRNAPLRFVSFKITASAQERHTNFYVFLDYFTARVSFRLDDFDQRTMIEVIEHWDEIQANENFLINN